MPEKYCFIENCRCHRVVLAAHSQFLREMLKETDRRPRQLVTPAPDPARDYDLQTRSEIPDLLELGFSDRRNPAMAAAT